MEHRCCSKQKVKRGLWSPEEDEKLLKYITSHGHACWSSVPELAGLQRCGKSCRLRWINYLRPELKRGSFTAEEEQIIIDVHRMLGNRWADIAKHLCGRTDNEVKNFWNSCIKKKLIAQGIDPKTHTLIKTKLVRNISPRPEKKIKLYKKSHISYTSTIRVNTPRSVEKCIQLPTYHHTRTVNPSSQAYRKLHFNDMQFSTRENQTGIYVDMADKVALTHPPTSIDIIDNAREEYFEKFRFELDIIDDVSYMDDLLCNFGVTT